MPIEGLPDMVLATQVVEVFHHSPTIAYSITLHNNKPYTINTVPTSTSLVNMTCSKSFRSPYLHSRPSSMLAFVVEKGRTVKTTLLPGLRNTALGGSVFYCCGPTLLDLPSVVSYSTGSLDGDIC